MKTKKKSISGPTWVIFVLFGASKNFSGKSASAIFFLFLDLYCCVEFQKKLMKRFREKLVAEERTARQTDGRKHGQAWFIWHIFPGVQKKHTKTSKRKQPPLQVKNFPSQKHKLVKMFKIYNKDTRTKWKFNTLTHFMPLVSF